MSSAEGRKRVAVVVPKHRLWLWHQEVISALKKYFDVVVYVSPSAPPYPVSLKLWLGFESQLLGLGQRTLVRDTAIFGQTWVPDEDLDLLFILNLSESDLNFESIPVIEPRFENSADSLCLFAALIDRNNPMISFHLVENGEPLVASYVAIPEKITLSDGLQKSFARLIALAERATEHLMNGSRAAIFPAQTCHSSTLSIWNMPLFICRFFLQKFFGRLIRHFRLNEHWSVGILWADMWDIPHNVPLAKFKMLADDRRRFYADPFLFSDHGVKWLFVEEFEYRTKRGIISCAPLKAGATSISPRPVLSRPYHLSYPFVFRHGEVIYMVPETGSNRTVELYRARSFPFDWELDRVLLDNIELYDSTILRYGNRWWIFGAIGHQNGSAQDELAVFYSDRLDTHWKPHRLNPVKSDCRSARPAGRVIMIGDRLLRPAQDCENGYGTGLVWLEIDELTPEKYSEREIARWPGTAAKADGIHTFNYDGETGAIDIRRNIWSLSAARQSR
jgi:hypothetical protein